MNPLAEALGAVRDEVRTGRLPASGSSRTRIVARADLLQWVERRRVRPKLARADDDERLTRRAAEIVAVRALGGAA